MAGVLEYALSLDTSAMTQALSQAQASLAGVQGQLAAAGARGDKAFNGTAQGARAAAAGVREAAAATKTLTDKLSSAGATAANIWAGAKAVGEAWRATSKFFQNGGISAALTRVKNGLSTIARDPGLRRLALAAAAAATAVGGTALAIRALRTAGNGARAAASAIGSIGSAAGRATRSVAAMAAKFTGIGSLLAALGGGVGALSALSKAADFETLNTSFSTLIGNAEETTRVMGDLKKFANVTPFSTSEVLNVGKNLIALGSDTKTLVAEMRALGDVASGMNIPLGELAEIYGKARTQGTLFAEDLNQLAGRGVPIFQKLAEVLGVSTGEVKKLASEGQITFPLLQKVFSDLTTEGGKFFGMMEKQSATTKGLLSTLKSSLDDLLVTIGSPINDFLKPIIAGNIARMQALNQRVTAFLTLLSKAREQGQVGELLGAGFKVALIEGINTLSSGVRGAVAYLAAALPPVFAAARDILTSERTQIFFQSLFTGLGNILSSLVNEAAANFLAGIGRAGAAADLRQQGNADAERAANLLQTARAALATADFSGTLDQLGASLAQANAAGVAAFQEASNKPLIDQEIAREEFKNIAGALDPAALQKLLNPPVEAVTKQIESLEEALGGLKTGIQKATPKPKPDTEDRRPQTAATRPGLLTRAAGVIDPPEGRRRGLLGVAASAAARLARGGTLTNTDRLSLNNTQGRLLNPARAAEALARGSSAADPGRVRREEKADTARKAADPLYRVVKSIEEKFGNLATA
jgi:tape measure domain-containing protein